MDVSPGVGADGAVPRGARQDDRLIRPGMCSKPPVVSSLGAPMPARPRRGSSMCTITWRIKVSFASLIGRRYRPVVPGREGSPGGGDFVPQAAVEVEVVAMRLARDAVADVGVEGMSVVGRLGRAVGALDRAERAAYPGGGGHRACHRRPVHST